jgi:serine/threonine protein phosphatase PrpC
MNRVGGVLAVSRAIGDFSVRNSGLISVPTIKKRMLKASDKFIVIASDGVWDEISDQDAVNYCKEEFSSK